MVENKAQWQRAEPETGRLPERTHHGNRVRLRFAVLACLHRVTSVAAAGILALGLALAVAPAPASAGCFANPDGWSAGTVYATNNGHRLGSLRTHVTACILYSQAQGGGYVASANCDPVWKTLNGDSDLQFLGGERFPANVEPDVVLCMSKASWRLTQDLTTFPPRRGNHCVTIEQDIRFYRQGGHLVTRDTDQDIQFWGC